MASLQTLEKKFPGIADMQLETGGMCLWIVGEGARDESLGQVFEEFAGVPIADAERQSLWFFFGSSACLASARLRSWSRFNQLAVSVQLFSTKLLVGRGGELRVTIEDPLRRQDVEGSTPSQIWVHPSSAKLAVGVLGISLLDADKPSGMSGDTWQLLQADTRLPYQAVVGWYVVLTPVGLADKKLLQGWRDFFSHVEPILQRGKIRYNTSNLFLMFQLDSIRQLKGWCRDYLSLVSRLQQEKPQDYWPCVSVITERKGLMFNDELPEKIGLNWKLLTPDFPHMSKQAAISLGKGFSFHEDRFAPLRFDATDWCSVALASDDASDANLLPNLVPLSSMGDYKHCFYCGQRSHEAAQCPTRIMGEIDPDTWRQISFLDFTAMRESINKVDTALATMDAEGVNTLIAEATPVSHIIKAIYDMGWPAQLRSLGFFWLAKDKNLDKTTSPTKKDLASSAWSILENYTQYSQEALEHELVSASARTPRDFRLLCLRGFAAMEKGEEAKAISLWAEAESSSPYPVVASWHSFLQARAYECMNNLDKAQDLYDQISRACPTWSFALYRKVVCEVKRGFSGQAMDSLNKIIARDGNFFNKVLIDPELERGHIQIFSNLVHLWRVMEMKAKEEMVKLQTLRNDLNAWFVEDNPTAVKMGERISMLLQMGRINNFVTLKEIGTGRLELEKDLQDYVMVEASNMKHEFHSYGQRLESIREQAAWFPFPRILAEFNMIYNECVLGVNWLFSANLAEPSSFKKATSMLPQEKEKLEYLEGRMKTLCMIRDATLFVLTLVETFFWVEIVGIVFIYVLLPLILVYGGSIGMDWTASVIADNREQVQTVLFYLLSILAIGVAGLRTVLRFDKIRAKVLAKAKDAPNKKKEKAQKKKKKEKEAE